MRWNIHRITSGKPSCSLTERLERPLAERLAFFSVMKFQAKADGLSAKILAISDASRASVSAAGDRRAHGAIISLHLEVRIYFPVLRHAGPGIIDRAVTVRVKYPHDVSDWSHCASLLAKLLSLFIE